MEYFDKTVNGWKQLTIFTKGSNLDSWYGSEYAFEAYWKRPVKTASVAALQVFL